MSGTVQRRTPMCRVIWGRNLSAWPRPDFHDRNHGRSSIIDGRSIQAASRCIIGNVDGQGDGQAILCAPGCYPAEAGAALLGRYSEEPLIDELIALVSIAWLDAEPKECEAHHRDRGYPWEHSTRLAVPAQITPESNRELKCLRPAEVMPVRHGDEGWIPKQFPRCDSHSFAFNDNLFEKAFVAVRRFQSDLANQLFYIRRFAFDVIIDRRDHIPGQCCAVEPVRVSLTHPP